MSLVAASAVTVAAPVIGLPGPARVLGCATFAAVLVDPDEKGHPAHSFRPHAAPATQEEPTMPSEDDAEDRKKQINRSLDHAKLRHGPEQQRGHRAGSPENRKYQTSHIGDIAQELGEKVTHV